MREPIYVSSDQVKRRLKDAGWKFKRETKRVEIWKRGTGRMDIPKRDRFQEEYVRILCTQAGLSKSEIDAFLRECDKVSQ